MRWLASTLSVVIVGPITSRQRFKVGTQALTPDVCKLDAIWKLATRYLKTFWLNRLETKKPTGSGSVNPSRMRTRISSGVQMFSAIFALSERIRVEWSTRSCVNVEPISALCAGISLTSPAIVKQRGCGLKNQMLSQKMSHGFQQTRKVAQSAKEISRKTKDVIIWRALSVAMNSVGYAWVIGKVTALQLEATISVTCMKIRRKMRPLPVRKLSERTRRRSCNVICGTTSALPTTKDQDNLLSNFSPLSSKKSICFMKSKTTQLKNLSSWNEVVKLWFSVVRSLSGPTHSATIKTGKYLSWKRISFSNGSPI